MTATRCILPLSKSNKVGHNTTLMIVAFIMFLAVFTQATAGFGMALVSMPLLVALVGIDIATPLVSLLGIAAEVLIIYRYRQALSLRAVTRLSLASVVGIPLGVFWFARTNGRIVMAVLGVIVTGYALYALITPRLPQLVHNAWAYGFGFIGGVLSGAFNTSGRR